MRFFLILAVLILLFEFPFSKSLSLQMSYRGGGGGRGRGRGGGRGEYYKNKYGGGGRGRGGRGGSENFNRAPASGGGSYNDLLTKLERLDGKSYGAYHDLDTPLERGWVNDSLGYTLFVERAQSDPFAAPTRCRVVLDASRAAFPPSLYANRVRSIALADYLLRKLHDSCKRLGADNALEGKGWSGPKGGDLQVLEPNQHVLEQSATRVDSNGNVIVQLTINLPARGRNILGFAAIEIFSKTLPALVQQSLLYRSINAPKLQHHVESVEDQIWLQSQLDSRNLVAFIRNGSTLPRKSGVDDRPMDSNMAILFESPKRLEVSFQLPNAGVTISGMGIPKGITLICGGGFHGKSTLLQALQCGIHPKVPSDGREFCLTSYNSVKIRAEDGRSIQSADISNFINNLPFGKDTTNFGTPDASGSTSQAANIVESIEMGADTLLVDEDTCATNFMIRDGKMMKLVAPEKEPITPFVSVVRSLYDDCGISSVMVIGGVGDYFDVADNVIVMDCYKCVDRTEAAKQIVANSSSAQSLLKNRHFKPVRSRSVVPNLLSPNGKVKVLSKSNIAYGETEIDISFVEQVTAKAQTLAISNSLQSIHRIAKGNQSLREMLLQLDSLIDQNGLDALAPGQLNGGMARPRRFEIAAAINRYRTRNSIIQTIII